MSLLPSEPDAAAADDDAEPRVVGVESDDADELLAALSSTTARRLLGELHEQPAPPAALAERVDTSLQNAQYHLEKLEDAGAVTVVDTAYSQKGREMDVYAPADRPLVIFAGDDDDTTSVRSALTRLLGGFGALALASAIVEQLFGDGVADAIGGFFGGMVGGTGGGLFGRGGDGADGAGAGAPTDTATPTEAFGDAAAAHTPTAAPPPPNTGDPSGTPGDLAAETAAGGADMFVSGGSDAAAGLPPGLLFFLGGATVLVAGFAVWYLGR